MICKRGIVLRKILTRSIVLMVSLAILCTSMLDSFAISDNGLWEDSKYCQFLDPGDESNSDLCFAAVKVRYNRDINRIYLLFMLEFDDFIDDKLSGVIMNFNGMGNIKVMSDGTAEYDNEVYFAELNDEICDRHSRNILFEATVGIKSGIPDSVTMNVNIIDTKGIKSNTYSVDITEDPEDEPTDSNSGSVTQRKPAEKTKKVRTTKVKTTKIKSTKHKTTKIKKSKTRNAEEEDNEDEEAQTVIKSDIIGNAETNNKRKNIMLILGAAAAVAAIAAGCSAGIKNKKKDKDGGHEE